MVNIETKLKICDQSISKFQNNQIIDKFIQNFEYSKEQILKIRNMTKLKFESRNDYNDYVRLKKEAKTFHDCLIKLLQNLDKKIVKKYLIL